MKKETLALVFSCEFYEISKNTFFQRTPFFKEHLWTTASVKAINPFVSNAPFSTFP